ncbi:type I-E CRISPR-associated endoribonuclease Cas2 [Streptomyces subrutilus]|uniref:Type I-E CRISPR-associated endoribonuclease Cas2 n=2 Tax=Streptomyces subrutilus TaxID=36818 RepID=A0A918VGV1_9ACTN|nr:type I-E CRISPR-associated endoribonuclease Cas2 [Streptomyces subrutilus]
MVVVLTQCPVGLRGFLTRWLLEISPGVFIGDPSARIRELLWSEVRSYANNGRALLAYSSDKEQGFAFETHDHKWNPVDHEGVTLIHRPNTATPKSAAQGWSKAAKRRRFGNI